MRRDPTEQHALARLDTLRREAERANLLRRMPRRRMRSQLAALLLRLAVRLEPDLARASRPPRLNLP